MTTVLLVIDAQRSFYEGFHLPPWDPMPPMPDAAAKLAALTGLVGRARAAGVPVVFVQHDEPGSELEPGKPTWELHPALGAGPGEPRIHKRAPDAFAGTGLKALLDDLGATRLVIGGNQTDMCVDASVRAAAGLGYPVTLAADAHGTWPSNAAAAADIVAAHNAALAALAQVTAAAQIAFD